MTLTIFAAWYNNTGAITGMIAGGLMAVFIAGGAVSAAFKAKPVSAESVSEAESVIYVDSILDSSSEQMLEGDALVAEDNGGGWHLELSHPDEDNNETLYLFQNDNGIYECQDNQTSYIQNEYYSGDYKCIYANSEEDLKEIIEAIEEQSGLDEQKEIYQQVLEGEVAEKISEFLGIDDAEPEESVSSTAMVLIIVSTVVFGYFMFMLGKNPPSFSRK